MSVNTRVMSEVFKMELGMATDVGRYREINEDSLGRKGNLVVVADGMGGHSAGEVASALAVEHILRLETEGEAFIDSLRRALNEANQALLDYAAANPDCSGMGTTIALVKVEGDKAIIAHVGDSRVYLWQQGELHRMTRDHSVVEELIRNGGITEEEAKTHPQRNLLTRALGTPGEVEIEISEIAVNKGDRILLCTDGLTSMLDHEEIKEVISRDNHPQIIAETLVHLANERGGLDNISVVVVAI